MTTIMVAITGWRPQCAEIETKHVRPRRRHAMDGLTCVCGALERGSRSLDGGFAKRPPCGPADSALAGTRGGRSIGNFSKPTPWVRGCDRPLNSWAQLAVVESFLCLTDKPWQQGIEQVPARRRRRENLIGIDEVPGLQARLQDIAHRSPLSSARPVRAAKRAASTPSVRRRPINKASRARSRAVTVSSAVLPWPSCSTRSAHISGAR